jgi:hypothetical protein
MTDPTRNGWTRCPPGTFVRLTGDLAARRTRQAWLTGVGVALGVGLTVAVCWQAAAAIDDWSRSGWTPPPAHKCQPAPPACQPAAPCAPGEAPKQK